MADILDKNGLTLSSYTDVLEAIQAAMTAIYATDGDTINFDSETPDGQFTNILAQMSSDNRELAREIYNSFNPDNCQGSVQDQRYALNYITRDSGSYTIQYISITVSQTVTLQGLDGNVNDENTGAYTVSDNAGNLWYLMDTTTITYVEENNTVSLPFRAQYKGAVMPTINTITNQTTKVLGVTAVNNPATYTSIGSQEESDLQFRIRRNRSTATRGQNNYDAMLGQILEIDGVTDANIHVNNTSSTDSTGTTAYSIWVIVEGGNKEDIANVIYQNSAGLPTYAYSGSGIVPVTENVTAVSGQTFTVTFNREASEDLYIRFTYKTSLTGEEFTNVAQMIAETMALDISYSMNEIAETSSLTEIASQAIAQNGGNGYALNLEISTDGTTWTDYIEPTSMMYKFTVSSANITINEAT